MEWIDFRGYLKAQLDETLQRLLDAKEEREMFILVGRARQLRELMNLSDTQPGLVLTRVGEKR